MAEKAQITEETSDRIERIRAAMAAGQKVSEDDKNWIEDFDAKQEIIQSALTEGRHVETSKLVTDEGTTHINWTEYVPMPDGTTLLRTGFDVIKAGPSSDVIVRTANYFDGNTVKGTLTSFISEGHERITGITGFGPGGEYAGLQIGDTRPSPFPSNSPAGPRPSSWDPSNFGKASGGAGPTPGMVDPLQQDIDAFVNQALNAPLPGDQSGGPSQTQSSGSSQRDSSDTAGLGSPGMRGTEGGGRMGDSVDADPGQGGGDDHGDPSSAQTNDQPDPGTEDQGGGDEKGDPSSAQTNDQPPPTEQSQQSSGASEDVGFTVEGSFEHVENVNTGQVGAKTESGNIATTAGTVKPVEGHWEDTDERTTDDGYSYIGESPPAQQGATNEVARSTGGGGGGSARSESFNPHDPAHAASLVTQYDPEGAPIDYGNASDPFHDPVIPTSDEMAKPDEITPLILVDPSFYEESATGPTTELEMVDSLMNTGNPFDENQANAPAGEMPNTSEQELVVGDGLAAMTEDVMAANEPDLAGAMEAPAIGEGAPGALSDDDPLP